MSQRFGRGLARTALLILLAPGLVQAAGFQSIEQGTWDMGRASVGIASAADSAATAFFNPAGMVLREQPELTAGGMVILMDSEFDVGPGTTFTGGDGGNAGENGVVPSGPFFVYPVDEDLALGFSLTAPFVGTLDYGSTWAGRYMIQKIEFMSMRFAPAVGYRVNEWLSVGGYIGFNYTELDIKAAVPIPAPGDGQLHIKDADQWVVNFSLGAMLEPWEGTRIGLSYTSEVDNDDMHGSIKVSGAAASISAGLDTKLTLPQAFVGGIRQEVTDKLVLFADAWWVDFSAFDAIKLDLSTGVRLDLITHFSDTYAYGFGAEYELDPEWTLMAGYSYASSPVRGKNRNPSLPFDRQIRYAAGVRHAWNETMEVAFSYEYLDFGNGRTNQTLGGGDTLQGEYDTNHAHFFALTLNKRF